MSSSPLPPTVPGIKLGRFFQRTSLSTLAHQTGLRVQLLGDIESGRVNPTDDELRRIARALHMSEDDAPLLLHRFPSPLRQITGPGEPQVELAAPESVQ